MTKMGIALEMFFNRVQSGGHRITEHEGSHLEGLPGTTEGDWQMEELAVNLVTVTSFGHRA